MGKTIAERLRDIEHGGCHTSNMSEAVFGEQLACSCKTCSDCEKEFRNRLADAIEAEQAANPSKSTGLNASKSMPLDADGQPCFLDDAVWHEKHKKAVVAVSHKGKVCLRFWSKRDKGDGGKWVDASEVTHRKPDTQEAIDEDAAKDPCEYFNGKTPEKCAECRLHDGDPDFDFEVNYAECRTAMNRDLLRRQRKLIGGE